jgi:hypothetical protein
VGEGAGEHLRGSNEDPLGVECRKRKRPEGAIAALSSSESMSAGVPGIERAGTDPSPTRRLVFALALVMLTFAAFYPYAEATGSCGDPGCPEFSHVHSPVSTEIPGALVAVLAAVPMPALAGGVRLRPASDRRPAEVYLSPDPEPPRL